MCAVAIQDTETVKVLLEGGVECNEPLRHNTCKGPVSMSLVQTLLIIPSDQVLLLPLIEIPNILSLKLTACLIYFD